jgi:hypothetical protein
LGGDPYLSQSVMVRIDNLHFLGSPLELSTAGSAVKPAAYFPIRAPAFASRSPPWQGCHPAT